MPTTSAARALMLLAALVAVLAASGNRPGDAAQTGAASGSVSHSATAMGQRYIVELQPAPVLASDRLDRAGLRDRVRGRVDAAAAALPRGVTIEHRLTGIAGLIVTADAAGAAALRMLPGVTSVTPDTPIHLELIESARLIRADEVRQGLGLTGNGVTVAVIDSGIDTDLPDIVGDVAFEQCYLAASGCPVTGTTSSSGPGAAEDDNGHGTRISGIITSSGNVAPLGISPATQVGAYKVVNSAGAGSFSDVLLALNDIIANHPEVRAVNMSLSDATNHGTSCDASFPTFATAMNTLYGLQTLPVAAAGNNGFTNGLGFPACLNNVLSVGGVWDDTQSANVAVVACTEAPIFDRPMCLSNSATTLDVLAPGGHITTSQIGGGAAMSFGTSSATPHATAAAAMLWSQTPSLTPAQVENALEANGVARTDPKNAVVTPRIDLWKAAASMIADPDGDGLNGPLDNCPLVANGTQDNSDRNFIDNSPPYAVATDDKTRTNSDNLGDACDDDDDNDGLTDAAEAAGCNTSGPLNALAADTDGDRFLDGAECTLGTNPGLTTSTPALSACGPTSDGDGDKINDRTEFCFYNSRLVARDTDADSTTGGAKDGCEVASLNGDQIVSSGDQGMLAAGISGAQPYTINVDINKDGNLNSGDQGLMASFISPPGQCP